MLKSLGAPDPLDRPLTVGPVMLSNLALVTAPAAMVAANEPVPLPVTSEVRLIVWSPVLLPLKFEPLTAPEAATLVGVIAPRPRVMLPLLVIGLPETEIPLATEIPTEVTVPPPAAVIIWATVARLLAAVTPSTKIV